MILINNINLPLDTDFSVPVDIAADVLNIKKSDIISAELYRKSVDARRKGDVHFCCSFTVSAKNEQTILKKNKNAQAFEIRKYNWQKADIIPHCRPIIAGFGPAGMFAALSLARAGLCPIVLERGKAVDERIKDVNAFFSGKALNPESNIQFGEGGAGTFSDGKLNSGIKDPRCRTVLEEFVKFGAPKRILTDAKPHIGTDILIDIVKNIRKEIIALGGEVRFTSRLQGIKSKNGKLVEIKVNGESLPCEDLILATGHSARDTFEMLKNNSIEMMRKPFSMGVRIEHLQSDINRALYGSFAEHSALGSADYKLAVHLPDGRGVYTFCMCPGGEVINASSEVGRIAVNGMSNSRRDGKNANSAVLVNVEPSDLEGDDVLAGCELQRKVESNAFKIGNGAVPYITLSEFLGGKPDTSQKVKPTVKPCVIRADFDEIFPEFITRSLREGILAFNKKLYGFSDGAALLTAPETRSSSPIRILRGEDAQSVSVKGLFPCGEGAGYAGGIMSAATDGLKSAEAVILKYKI